MSSPLSRPRDLVVVEALAVVLNLAFTYFYLRHHPICYLFGAIGPLLFIYLCIKKQLFAEVVLQLVYILMALYGWITLGLSWPTKSWSVGIHLLYILAGGLVVMVAGRILRKYTRSKLPYLDSTTTTFGIIGTWAMVNYVHANWLYFIAINALSIYLYGKRKMYLGAAMYVLYLLMAIDGYFRLHWFYS